MTTTIHLHHDITLDDVLRIARQHGLTLTVERTNRGVRTVLAPNRAARAADGRQYQPSYATDVRATMDARRKELG